MPQYGSLAVARLLVEEFGADPAQRLSGVTLAMPGPGPTLVQGLDDSRS